MSIYYRWLFYYDVLESFITSKNEIDHCCSEILKIDTISNSAHYIILELHEILKIYKKHTIKLQAERYPTLPLVLPSIVLIMFELEENKKEIQHINNFIDFLISDLKKRTNLITSPIVNPSPSSNYNLAYSLSTFLDPRCHRYLSLPHLIQCKELAYKFLKPMVQIIPDSLPVESPIDSGFGILDKMVESPSTDNDEIKR